MNKLEILEYNYWEHFKALKEMSLILPLKHPRRLELESEVNKLQKEINDLKRSNGIK
jgi:hypothetical protein